MRHAWLAHHRPNQPTAMNKDNAVQFLPLVQALADGKTIQINNGSEKTPIWTDQEEWLFGSHLMDYRIKPEPREWKAVVIKDTEKNSKVGRRIGTLAAYDDGDEDEPDFEVVRVREILD